MERAVLILLFFHLLGHLSQPQEDEVIFISGGISSGTPETSTEVLDIFSSSSPCSRTTGDLPESRHGHSMDKMGDAILICGSSSTSHSCVSSSNASGPWLQHSTLTTNQGRWRHSSSIADGRLHLIAGFSYDRTMESLDEGVWTEQRLSYSFGAGSCSVQTSHDSFIVTGGDRTVRMNSHGIWYVTDGYSSPRTWEWKAGTWRELEEMKVGRHGHACGTIVKGDKVFLVVAGGYSDSDGNIIQSSEVFAEGKWQDMGDLVKARKYARIVTVRVGGIHKMIIMGGDDVNNNDLNSVEELVVNDNMGQSIWQLSEATMKKPRSFFGAVSVPKSKFCDNST